MQGAKPGTLVQRVAPRGPVIGRGNAGFTTPGTMASMASGAIVMAGATAGYQIYLNAANELGESASDKSLCKELQDADRDAILTGKGGLQVGITEFIYASKSGVVYDVKIRNTNGCCHFIATYTRKVTVRNFWISIFGVDAIETVEPLHPTRGTKCPANARQIKNGGAPRDCKPI